RIGEELMLRQIERLDEALNVVKVMHSCMESTSYNTDKVNMARYVGIASLVYSLAIYFFGRWILRSSLWKKSYKFESIKSNSQELGSLTEGESRLIKKEDQLCFGEVKNLDSRVLFHTLNETDGDIVPLSDFNSQFYLLNKDQNQKKVSGKFGQSMKSKSFSEFGAIKNQDEQHTKISGLKRKVSRSDKSLVLIFNKSNLIFTIDKSDQKRKHLAGIELEF
ncbi:hypothetical protein BpHYR1_030293, partial [Brachionus plicatilis]